MNYPVENDESSFEIKYSQCAIDMERLFSGQPVDDEEFPKIGDSWSRFERLFFREFLAKGYSFYLN